MTHYHVEMREVSCVFRARNVIDDDGATIVHGIGIPSRYYLSACTHLGRVYLGVSGFPSVDSSGVDPGGRGPYHAPRS